jgi:hypothetical protein
MTGVTAIMAGMSGGIPLAVTANDVSGTSFGFSFSGPVATVDPNTTVTGGTAPFTFAWAYVSGSSIPEVSNAAAQNPFWSNSNVPDGTETATWRVTVTDANNSTATHNITVELTWVNLN